MKTIVKLCMMLALAVSVSVISAEAQPGYGKGPHGHGAGVGHGFGPDSCHIQLMVEDLSDALSLSEEQKAEILNIHYAHMQEMQTVLQKYKDDCVGEQEARMALRKKMDEAVKKILTADQQTKYDEFMDERKCPHGQHSFHGQ